MNKERVELHAHTHMSGMDGIASAADLILRAADWGHPAIAVTDHGVVQAFPEAMQAAEQCRERGQNIKVLYGMEAYMDDENDSKGPPCHISLLAQNRSGLKNLYKLVTWSHLYNFDRRPGITRRKLLEHREGLLLGSACEQGELFRAILAGKPWDELCAVARFYDFLEIQPLNNTIFLLQEGMVKDEEALRDFNRTIVRLGEELHIPVCATGDVHILDPEDAESRRVLWAARSSKDAVHLQSPYFRSTEDMLREFAYLGEEKSREVAVENSNRLADLFEELRPIPEGTYYPQIAEAEERLITLVRERAEDLYGDPLPEIVSERLEQELSSIRKTGDASLLWIAHLQVSRSLENGYRAMTRGAAASILVAYLAGITEINPLEPHYRCPHCRHTEFFIHGEVESGYDLPAKACPLCGQSMIGDGQGIPWESFRGIHGDKAADIDLNFASKYQAEAYRHLQSLFGQERVVKAGTISTLAGLTALAYARRYNDEYELGLEPDDEALTEWAKKISGVKRGTGQHPGGVVIIPEGYEAEDFTPLQYPDNDPRAGVITTHFDFHALHNTMTKLDDLGHTALTVCRRLEEYTGIPVTDADVSDPAVYRLFTSPEPLGVTAEQIGWEIGSLSLPEFGTSFAQEVLLACQPHNFSELVKVSGLLHGTDVWKNNACELLDSGLCDLSAVIGNREDVYIALKRRGLPHGDALRTMEAVGKGLAKRLLTEEYCQTLREHGVPDWYVESCLKILYLFPKAHGAEYVLLAVRLGWYKLYHPAAYYTAWLAAQDEFPDSAILDGGAEAIRAEIGRNQNSHWCDGTRTSGYWAVILEAVQRGIRFLPADLYRSASCSPIPEAGAVRLPLTSIKGISSQEAAAIVKAREQKPFHTVKELQSCAGLSGRTVETLHSAGMLDDLLGHTQ